MIADHRIIARIRELSARGLRPADIAVYFNMKAKDIRIICEENGIPTNDAKAGPTYPVSRWDRSGIDNESEYRKFLAKQDFAFKRAMLNARKAGTEQVTIGVGKSDGEFRPQHFEREPIFSICGSQAASCVDSGDD